MSGVVRCPWADGDPLLTAYHDHEWGVPLHDDRRLFEMLTLEGAQAGLSWLTVLRKRERYRTVFEAFDAARVAAFDEAHVGMLLEDPGIVRNRAKIAATIANARAVLDVQREYGSFDAYIWRPVGRGPQVNSWTDVAEVPASTPQSDAMSNDLRKRGFSFVGSTICYAFMQACGLVDDHLVTCFRYGAGHA